MKIVSENSTGLNGKISIPGDKSISHRALMLGALAKGMTRIEGLLEGEDVLRTADALRAMGADIRHEGPGQWTAQGSGTLRDPGRVLDMGNAGTGVRLLMGLVASYPLKITFTGDASLRSRPMKRVTEPLSLIGASFEAADGVKLPLTVIGTATPKPASYTLPVASAQVKSALLLAGLNIDGETVVYEPVPCRDHTERMLKGFGADITAEPWENGRKITLRGKASLRAADVHVPADVSSAAFPMVAALITPASEIVMPGVGINPLRAGIIDVLREMGGDIQLENRREEAGEPVADLRARSSRLKGIDVPAEKAPSMIDEYPVLAVAAAFAEGVTRLKGLSELKVKESNRFDAIIEGLRKNGIAVQAGGDSLVVPGKGENACGGGLIEAKLDHRMAMAFMVMGMASERPVLVDDVSSVATSFPDFIGLMNAKGAHIHDYRD